MGLRPNLGNRSDLNPVNFDPQWTRERDLDDSDDSSELNLVQAILGHKLLLVFFAIVGAGLGYLRYVKTPPVYASSARLRLVHTAPVMGGIDGLNDRFSSRSPTETQVVLMTSPLVLDRAVLKLQEGTSRLNSLNAQAISTGLRVFSSEHSDEIVDLRYQGNDPKWCQEVLNAVLAAYVDYLGESQGSSSQRMFALITQAKDELLADLAEKESAYAKFRNEASLLWSGNDGKNLHAERLSGIESQRARVILERTMLESQLKSVQALITRGESREAIVLMIDQLDRKNINDSKDSALAGSPRSIAQELMPLLLEEQLLLERFGTGHPKVKEIQKKIEVSRSLMELQGAGIGPQETKPRPDMLTVYLESLNHEIEAFDEQLVKLNSLFTTEEVAAKRLSIEENQSRALQDDLNRTKQLFEAVLTKLQSMELNKDTGTLSAEPVVLPSMGYKVEPTLPKSIAIGSALGIFVAILIGILIEKTDRSYRTPQDISRHLNIPVIGHVPALRILKPKTKSGSAGHSLDPSIISHHRPNSAMTESYRTIRTALMLGMKSNNKIIQVTSPNPGDGKSTLSSNLAITVANSGKRCLLLECDLRRPRVHKLFNADNKAGLSTVILQQAELADAICHSVVENLDLLTCGPHIKNPAELFLKPEFGQLLEVLRDRYDTIIIDSPPVLAVSDSTIVASMVDGIILVARVMRNSRPMLSRAHGSLSMVGGNVLGVVVNGTGGDRSTYQGSYNKYSAYHGYGYHDGRYGKYSPYHDETPENGVHQRQS